MHATNPNARSHGSAHALALAPVLLALALLGSGCTPGNAHDGQGTASAELAAAVGRRRIPPIIIDQLTPTTLATDATAAQIKLVAEHRGREVATFPYTDLYFKVLFLTLEELRALGVDARADESLLLARHQAYQNDAAELSSEAIDYQLSRVGAEQGLQGVLTLTLDQKRSVLASRRLLIASRSGLPLDKQPEAPSGRTIFETYFQAAAGLAKTRLQMNVGDASVHSDGLDLPEHGEQGRQTASVELEFALIDPTGRTLASHSVTETVSQAGSGVVPRHSSYALQVRGAPPLELAIRAAARGLAEELVDVYPQR